jgi:hypothetical protein
MPSPVSYPKRNLGILRGNHLSALPELFLFEPWSFPSLHSKGSEHHLNPNLPRYILTKMRAVQVSEYVKVPTTNPNPQPQPKLTTPIGSPRPQSNNSPNPNPNSGQISNRNPLRRHKLLRHPPNPRQIPTPTATPLDRWRRIRRYSNRRAHLCKQPLQTR